ncbi:MAG: endonuclease/exonuclease/phosphatase family protein [Desulfobacteraceae bacterium]|jgi:endonuclease/exonuclease/phosphatase family metal-dependent hydrolase
MEKLDVFLGAMRRSILLLAAVLLLGAFFPSDSVVPATSDDESEKDRLVVVTYNIGGRFKKKTADSRAAYLADVIVRPAPDLVFLQECTKKDHDSLKQALGMKYTFFIPYQGKGKSGLAVLSIHPLSLRDVHFFTSSTEGLGFVLCDVVIQGHTIHLANAHLDRIQRIRAKEAMPHITWKTALDVVIKELSSETRRCEQVTTLLERLRAWNSNPVILAGDFNTIPFATAIRKVQDRFRDVLWPSLDYFNPTYKDLGFLMKPRIDYIFHSPGISTEASGIIRSGPGDHYPVWAELIVHPGNGERRYVLESKGAKALDRLES